MNEETFAEKIDRRIEQFQSFKTNTHLFDAVALMSEALGRGNKILVFGNGGSSTQSSHFAAELVNRFYRDRSPLAALALTTDIANLTSIANDCGYHRVFSRQLEALARPGDIALGISTSGKSDNVLQALKAAKKRKMTTVALCGSDRTHLHKLGIDVIISIPSDDTPLIQEMHLFVLHMIAEMLEKTVLKGDK
jgi:D-sedoheptulose 7-phosphate isomerase